MTECQNRQLLFTITRKPVCVDFSGGDLTSDAGVLLLAAADRKLDLCERIAATIPDARVSGRSLHEHLDMIRQRVYSIGLGYEDCNDADDMRSDPALKLACARLPMSHEDLASQPTLSRLENRVDGPTLLNLHRLMLDVFLQRQLALHGGRLPRSMTLDLDSTCDPTHGQQAFSFFNGHYDTHMYHPIVCTVGQELLGVCLRPGNVGASAGVLNWLPYVLARLRELRPGIKIRIRGDAGFAAPEMYSFCEKNGCTYVIGLGGNKVLDAKSAPLLQVAKREFEKTGCEQKLFCTFLYRAGTWNRQRQVVVKVEVNQLGSNVRYVVHDLGKMQPERVYSKEYCGRGSMENNIKDLKNALAADRLSCSRFDANAFRILLHGFAYQLMSEVRSSLMKTEFETAQFDTIRLKLFKVAALVEETARLTWVRVNTVFPRQEVFASALAILAATP